MSPPNASPGDGPFQTLSVPPSRCLRTGQTPGHSLDACAGCWTLPPPSPPARGHRRGTGGGGRGPREGSGDRSRGGRGRVHAHTWGGCACVLLWVPRVGHRTMTPQDSGSGSSEEAVQVRGRENTGSHRGGASSSGSPGGSTPAAPTYPPTEPGGVPARPRLPGAPMGVPHQSHVAMSPNHKAPPPRSSATDPEQQDELRSPGSQPVHTSARSFSLRGRQLREHRPQPGDRHPGAPTPPRRAGVSALLGVPLKPPQPPGARARPGEEGRGGLRRPPAEPPAWAGLSRTRRLKHLLVSIVSGSEGARITANHVLLQAHRVCG